MAYSKIPRQDLELVEQIGSGGFSSVFKAKWKSKDVAAKRLNEPDMNEIEVLSGLDHPNIVNLLGVIDGKWEFFLILELCEEGSLRSYLDKHRGEKLKQFYDWAKQAGRPIEYLNKMKIIHKDVKSPNYLIAKGNVLKLADFGLAKRTDVTITATETASYAWMAPELLAEEKLSPSYDIFAYMVVVWELWTTQIPFEGSCPANILYRVCEGDERPPIPADMPKPLADLMRRCWDKDRSKRPSIDHILSVMISLEKEVQMISLEKETQMISLEKGAQRISLEKEAQAQLISPEKESQAQLISPEKESQMISLEREAQRISLEKEAQAQLISPEKEAQRISLEKEAQTTSLEKEAQHFITSSWMLEEEFGRQRPGMLTKACAIAVNPTTYDVAVPDYLKNDVKVYSNEGEYRFSMYTPPGRPSCLWNVTASAEGTYYVTDSTQHVKVYTGEGVYKCKWVAISHEDQPSDTGDTALHGLTMDGNGQLLVGQVCEPPYVSKHHQDGSHIASIKAHIEPHYLATTSQDTIIIGDNTYMNKVVQIVDITGNLLHTIHHSRHVSFWNPCGVSCYQDIVFISNTPYIKKHEITCFTVHGEYMGSIPVQMRPWGITFTKDGHKLLVACTDRVQVYTCKK